MPNPKTADFAVWSEAAESRWFDGVIYGTDEEGSEYGLTSTGIVCDRMELFGSPFREPLIPRHQPAPVLVFDKDEFLPVLGEKTLRVLKSPAPSKKEIRFRRKFAKQEETLAERCLMSLHFASQSNEPFDKKLAHRPKAFSVTM